MLASVFLRMERVILCGTPGCRVFEKPLREDNLTSHFRSFRAAAAALPSLPFWAYFRRRARPGLEEKQST